MTGSNMCNQLMINSATRLYGVFGNPISHSMGPVMHTRAFREKGINAVYLAFRIDAIEKGLQAMREIGIQGASITIPFKESVIPFLDDIGEHAKEMGSVNTVVNKDGKLFGYSTDHKGAVEPLRRVTPLKDKDVCVLGAGGAAKAVAYGLKKEGALLTISNRSENKGKALADQMDARFVALDHVTGLNPDIIINTTSVGMMPDTDKSPVPARFFHESMIVFDIVYNPLMTRFLIDAKNAGCTIIDGLSMFVGQGAAQFELFTGVEAPVNLMRDAVLEEMTKS